MSLSRQAASSAARPMAKLRRKDKKTGALWWGEQLIQEAQHNRILIYRKPEDVAVCHLAFQLPTNLITI